MNLFDQFRLVVGERGKVYDGLSRKEANRQFMLFVLQSKADKSKSAGMSVTLFKNYEIVREYQAPSRKAPRGSETTGTRVHTLDRV